ncbi:MAG: sugar ABC transporter permease [Chloroflexia bacterium]
MGLANEISRATRDRAPSVSGGRQARAEERAALLFLTPWIVGMIAFLIVPLLWSVWISMTDERLLVRGEFVGLANYVYMFTSDDRFYKALTVTAQWLLLTLPLYLIAGLLLSLLLNQKLPGMNFFRTLFYIPAVLPTVAVAILWLSLLNPSVGAINQVLRSIGVDNPPQWYNSPTWALPSLMLMGLWGVGGGAIIYLAGLQNIPPQLYEAASVDGAGPLTKFRHITLPMLSPTIFFLLVNGLIDSFLVFGPAFVLGQPGGGAGPDDALLFYMLYVYNQGFQGGGFMGYAAALAWVLTIISAIAVFLIFRFEKRFVFYETE